jgi:hypothetical protein
MLLQLVGKLCYITACELIPGVSRRPHYWIQTNLPLCYLELYNIGKRVTTRKCTKSK